MRKHTVLLYWGLLLSIEDIVPSSEKDRPAAGARIPRWKLWLLVLGCPAFAAAAAWWLHKSIVHPDPSAPGEIWLALSMLLMFGGLTLMVPFVLLVLRRARRQAARRASAIPEALTIEIPKQPLVCVFGICSLLLTAGVSMAVAGFEGVGRRSIVFLFVGLLFAGCVSLLIATYALVRWYTRGRPWRIRIDSDGIRDSRLGQLLISWSDVVSISRWTLRSYGTVAFRLRDPAAYRMALNPRERLWARLSGILNPSSYMLPLSTLSIEERELIDALRTFKPVQVAMVGFPEAGSPVPRT
jgi:hypothetical protein